jgi:hypothetical protein
VFSELGVGVHGGGSVLLGFSERSKRRSTRLYADEELKNCVVLTATQSFGLAGAQRGPSVLWFGGTVWC